MNKVAERCKKDSCAKFYYTSKRMFAELKYTKLVLYFLNIVPVVICFLPTSDSTTKLICSCISFALTLINLIVGAFLNGYKEKAIMEHQLYEASITGSSFSKIEYDRECTNDMHELAIRKGLPAMKKVQEYPTSEVPQEINDDYSYLYLCRISAAKTRFLLSRTFYGYIFSLVIIAVVLVCVNFTSSSTGEAIYSVVCCWPLITPLITNSTSCAKCMRQCSKICADIDNFFADGDVSVERLARFYYYVQNIEFEMLLTRPIIFTFVEKMFKNGVSALVDGVTQRFKEAIVELKKRSLMMKGVIHQPRGKGLITSRDYDLEYLVKKEKDKRAKKNAKKLASSPAAESAAVSSAQAEIAAVTGKAAGGTGATGTTGATGAQTKSKSESTKTATKPTKKK